MRHILIICHPAKTGSPVLKHLASVLNNRQLAHDIEHDLSSLRMADYTDLLVVGGDGTLNYVINHLPHHELPLGLVPQGTGNDYAKRLKLGTSLDQQIETAMNGSIVTVDLGKCNERLFVNGFGIGFDGQIAKDFDHHRGILKGQAAYYYHVIRILAGFKAKPLRFTIDGQPYRQKVLLMTVAKGTTFGGGFRLTPQGELSDGQLAVSIVGDINPLKRFLNLHRLSNGTHHVLKEVSMLKGKQVVIEGPSNLEAHMDGELIGNPPFEISIVPQALKVRVGET